MIKDLINLLKKQQYISGLFAVFLSWGIYFLVIWPQVLFSSTKGLASISQYSYGDWAIHFAASLHFAYQPLSNWLVNHPVFASQGFVYSFVADMISGLLIRFGVNQILAFIIPSIVTTFLFLTILFHFYFKTLKNNKLAFFALSLFFLNGSLGFIYWITDYFTGKKSLYFYTDYKDKGLYWINIIISEILPQRAFVLGLLLGLIVIYFLYKWEQTKFNNLKTYKIILIGLLAGILPIVHVQTYLVVFFISFIFLVKNYKLWKKYLVYAISAALPSIFIFFFLFNNFNYNRYFRFVPGWLALIDGYNLFYFLFINWGFFLILAIYSTYRFKLYKNTLILSAWLIFIICNLFVFQPFAWDNVKFFTWAYLILIIPVIQLLSYFWQKNNVYKLLTIILVGLMIWTGLIDLVTLIKPDRQEFVMITNQDISLAKEFRIISNSQDIVLTSTIHNHWVVTQTGNSVVMGYEGWIWSYGIDYHPTYADMQKIYAGDVTAKMLIKKYNISYIVVGPAEIAEFYVNQQYFKENFQLVLDNFQNQVYIVN